ncbi:MAG TPA: DUF952 domain-containing protein [Rhizomicrobium sp.]|nr:DUF952 domain-containing protein [Rhizomicrobium sp.]
MGLKRLMAEPVFKIVPRAEWAETTDAYEGSAHDRADGFLHFSTWPQLPETLRRYYADKNDLLLVAADPARLGRLLKWERSPSRGEDFPHLYGVLLTSAVLWVKPIARDMEGNFLLPT